MDEVNAYNQSKATIDAELSEAIQKSEKEKSEMETSKKRFDYIETRLPEIKQSLETLQQERASLETNIGQLKESINKSHEERKKNQ